MCGRETTVVAFYLIEQPYHVSWLGVFFFLFLFVLDKLLVPTLYYTEQSRDRYVAH